MALLICLALANQELPQGNATFKKLIIYQRRPNGKGYENHTTA
jgi:hypothetical protein